MSLYTHHFQLLQRPARSVLSIGSEASRATLPDFASVGELSQFTHRLVIWKAAIASTHTQAKVGACTIGVLIIIGTLILARKLYEGSFWVIRIIKRPNGTNPMLVFCLVEGFFGSIFIAFVFLCSNYFQYETMQPDNFVLWLTLPWCALIFGAVWTSWGTYFARPNALQSTLNSSSHTFLQHIFLRPYLINTIFGLILPGAISVSVIIPAVLANAHWQRALSMEQDWQRTYSTQTEFTQEMVQATQAIWFECLEVMTSTAITYIIWTVHGLWVGAVYTKISLDLIKTIRGELKRQKYVENTFVDPCGAAAAAVMPMLNATKQEKMDVIDMEMLKSGSTGQDSSRDVLVEEEEEEGEGEEQIVTGNYYFTPEEMNSSARCTSFFPPVRPDQIVGRQQTNTITTTTSAAAAVAVTAPESPNNATTKRTTIKFNGKTQRDYLKSALSHAIIQLCAVTPACICYAGIALAHALAGYGTLEQPTSDGGNRFEYFYCVEYLTLTWTTCLFGGVVVLAICHRTYEAVLSVAVPKQVAHIHALRNKGATNTSFFETKSKANPLQLKMEPQMNRLDHVGENVNPSASVGRQEKEAEHISPETTYTSFSSAPDQA